MGNGASKGSSSWPQQADRGSSQSRRAAAAAVGRTVLGEVLTTLIAVGGLVWALKLTLSYMDPYRDQRQESRRQAAALKARLGRNIDLNEYEMLLASNILNPRAISVSLDDIGGLDEIKEEMRLKVLKPLSDPVTFCTTLWRPAKGVLFYGPPGTGKTMLAKALARESGCFFLNVTASAVMSKWFGDANRFIRGIFTLAAKLEPCVIFIDEVDAFLTKRGTSSEHEATLQAKTEFMQLWDGMESCSGLRVLVMGATNRPWMVDDAVLRRFTLQYEVGLPSAAERGAIIRRYLLRHEAEMMGLAASGKLGEKEGRVDAALLLNRPVPGHSGGALDAIAVQTAGYSGSDLMEVCAQAAQNVLAEKWLHPEQQLRQLQLKDLQAALAHVKPSTTRADEYALTNHARRYSGAVASSSSSPAVGRDNNGWGTPEPNLLLELLQGVGAGELGGNGNSGGMSRGTLAAALAAAAAAAASAAGAGGGRGPGADGAQQEGGSSSAAATQSQGSQQQQQANGQHSSSAAGGTKRQQGPGGRSANSSGVQGGAGGSGAAAGGAALSDAEQQQLASALAQLGQELLAAAQQ